MRNEFNVERHVGKRWITTTSCPTKAKGLDSLLYFKLHPIADAREYRLVKVTKEEIAWVDTG